MGKALEQELFGYIMQLSDAEKKSVARMLKTFLEGRKANTGHITIEQYNKEIGDAVGRVEAGEFYTHEEVEKMSKEW